MRGLRARWGVLVAALVAAVALTGCGFHGLYGVPLPGGADLGSHPYTVTAYFSDVLDLVPQSAVKVNDVAVGKVTSIALSTKDDTSGDPATNGWTAKVEFQVNGDVSLPANARAEIRQTTLLGEKYVALEQPLDTPARARLAGGDSIPITRTGSAPEVEEVLGALSLLLNGGGLQQIRTITIELNKALHGHEGAVRDLLDQLNSFVGTLDRQKDEILGALDSVNRLAETLRGQTRLIEQTLDTFPQALQILRSERGRLVTLLTSLSHLGAVATRVITETQQDLVHSLKELSTPLEQLTASGSDLVQSLKIAGTFPFPIGTTLNAVKGDYANLALYLDLNLSNELCGLSQALCTAVHKVLPSSSKAHRLSATPGDLPREPALIGVGG